MVLIPVSVLLDYALGTPVELSVGVFVEIGIASLLYALLAHYFWDESQSSGSRDQSSPTTRSPR